VRARDFTVKGLGREVDQSSPTRAEVENDWSYTATPPIRLHTFCLPQDGTTPLILAAASGHVDCVKELLNQGADPRARRVVSV
jgi:ankyrin repeat protein